MKNSNLITMNSEER